MFLSAWENQAAGLIRQRVLLFFLVAILLTWFGHLGNALHAASWWPRPMFVWGPIIAAPWSSDSPQAGLV